MSVFVYSINPETELICRTLWNGMCAGIFIIVQLTLFAEYVPSKMPVDRDVITLDSLDYQYSTHQDTSDNHVARVCVHCLPCHSVSNITASLCMEVLPL